MRMKAKLTVWYKQVGLTENHKCYTNNISEDGLQIVTYTNLDKDKSITLEIEIPYPQIVIHVIGTIRWHKEFKDLTKGITKHIYGIKFDKIDQADQDNIFHYMYNRLKSANR